MPQKDKTMTLSHEEENRIFFETQRSLLAAAIASGNDHKLCYSEHYESYATWNNAGRVWLIDEPDYSGEYNPANPASSAMEDYLRRLTVACE